MDLGGRSHKELREFAEHCRRVSLASVGERRTLYAERAVWIDGIADQLQGAVEQRDLLLTAVREAMVSLNSGEVPTGHVAAYLRRMSSIVSGGQ